MGRAGFLAVIALVSGCNTDVDVGGTVRKQPATASGGASAGGGASFASGGAGMVFPPDDPLPIAPKECKSLISQKEGVLIPLDLFVMLEQSASMNEPLPTAGRGTWWSATREALNTFVTTESGGRSVGLQYFPLGGSAPDSCAVDYATPEVEVGALPGNALDLAASLEGRTPSGGAPTGPALAGALSYMRARPRSRTDAVAAVVLVVDGLPSECAPRAAEDLAMLAKEAFEKEPSVRTYVIGLRAADTKTALASIAKAGGTNDVLLVDGKYATDELLNALVHLDGTRPVCTYSLADALPSGADPDRVSVVHTVGNNHTEVYRVVSAEDCEAKDGDGWYFDDPAHPTSLTLCPASCMETGHGETSILYACEPTTGLTP